MDACDLGGLWADTDAWGSEQPVSGRTETLLYRVQPGTKGSKGLACSTRHGNAGSGRTCFQLCFMAKSLQNVPPLDEMRRTTSCWKLFLALDPQGSG